MTNDNEVLNQMFLYMEENVMIENLRLLISKLKGWKRVS